MIALVHGTVAERDGELVTILTDGGVGYAVAVTLATADRLPPGGRVTLHTELVVREDGWSLYGFDSAYEREVFRRLLGASGFGPKLALALVSHLGPDRTVRAVQARDLAALASVSGIGKKKAEKLVVELAGRFDDLQGQAAAAAAPIQATGAEGAVRALVALGYGYAQAEDAVQAALAAGAKDETAQLIRGALQQLAASRGGR